MKLRKWTVIIFAVTASLLAVVNRQPQGYSYQVSNVGIEIRKDGDTVGFAQHYEIPESAMGQPIETVLREVGITDGEVPAAVYPVNSGQYSGVVSYGMDAQFRHEIFLLEDCLYDLEMYLTGLGPEASEEVTAYFVQTVLPKIS